MTTLSIGVDVSKAYIDVAYSTGMQPSYLGQFENEHTALAELDAAIKQLVSQFNADDVLIVLEPTGGYEQLLARFAIDHDYRVALPNPKSLRHWAVSLGIRAKTDKQDALMLAQYGAMVQPDAWRPPDESVEVLSDLLHRIRDLQSMRQMERNRLEAHQHQPVTAAETADTLEQSIEFITQQMGRIEAAIARHFDENRPLAQLRDNLRSVPGVGEKNVLFLIGFLHRFDAMTDGQGGAKQLTAYAGLDPVAFVSGTSVNRPSGISKAGDSVMRQYLYLGALGGRRGNNPLAKFYQRLIDRGKPKMVALIACARKILVWSWAVFRQNSTFDQQRACPSS